MLAGTLSVRSLDSQISKASSGTATRATGAIESAVTSALTKGVPGPSET